MNKRIKNKSRISKLMKFIVVLSLGLILYFGFNTHVANLYSNLTSSLSDMHLSRRSNPVEVDTLKDIVELDLDTTNEDHEALRLLELEKLALELKELELENRRNLLEELRPILVDLLNQTPGRISLSLFCIYTEELIDINGDEMYFSASTIKLPTHMMVAEAVERGELAWDDMLTIGSNHWISGSGVLQFNKQIGSQLTLRDAMRYSIRYSDNVGHRMMTSSIIENFRHYEVGLDNHHWDLTRKVSERYLNSAPVMGRMFITANQLTEIFKVLYNDREVVSGYEKIIDYMINSSWDNRFKTELSTGIVAHTPGWTYPYSHDSGLFFTDLPYILVVLTHGVHDAPQFLSRISDKILMQLDS